MKIGINRNVSETAPEAHFELETKNNQEYWTGVYLPSQLERTIDGHNLILSKKLFINQDLEANLGLLPSDSGVVVDPADGGWVTFTCSYSLDPTVVEDHHDNMAVNMTRTAIGHLNYKIEFENSLTQVGHKTNFKIIPADPGLVYSRIQSCTMTHIHNRKLSYRLFWPMLIPRDLSGRLRRSMDVNQQFCKDRHVNFELLSPFQSQSTQHFQFTSFHFNVDSRINTHLIKCDLQLSPDPFPNSLPLVFC